VYLLKNLGGMSYVSLFNQFDEQLDLEQFGPRLGDIVRCIAATDAELDILRSVYEFETADERVTGTDVRQEIENIYSEATSIAHTDPYVLLDLSHSVHLLFESLPKLDIPAEAYRSKSYLFFRDETGSVTTLGLHTWQRELWDELIRGRQSLTRSDDTVEDFASTLAEGRSDDADEVRAAVGRIAILFKRVLDPSGRSTTLR